MGEILPSFVAALLLQEQAPSGETANTCLTFIITWAPFLLLVGFYVVYMRRMGYFTKRGGYIKRSEEHMERVEQTLTKIEEHLRKLAERDKSA